jgi:small nuclear ribonucleoprotein B and B'
MKVTLQDGRQMVGQMLAFDKVSRRNCHFVWTIFTSLQHMNLVLADTEEFRRTRRRGKAAPGATQQVTETEERRAIGLTIIRGAHVISLSVDGPPPADPAARLGATSGGPTTAAALAAGPGVARPAGRGLPVGLTGPAPGAGGPGPGFGGFPGAPPFGGPPGFAGRGGPPGGPRKSQPSLI